jgi:hypothetical protein
VTTFLGGRAMNKIPVGDTVSGAFNFAFARFLSVLGVFWLPYLLLAAILVASVHFLAPDLPGQIEHGPWDQSLAMNFRRISAIVFAFWLLASAMVTVGLQRQALGLHPGPVFFFFSLGAPVWRLIGAYILAILVIIFVVALTIGVCIAAWFGAASIGSPVAAGALRALAIIAGVCWVIYLEVRLMFFLPAVVVAENTIGLGRSWTLAGGNFWRIVGVLVVIFIPVEIGFGMVSNAVIGPFIPFDLLTHPPADPHMFVSLMMQQLRVIGPLYVVLALLERIVFAGLGNGAIATAYRHLVPLAAPVEHE